MTPEELIWVTAVLEIAAKYGVSIEVAHQLLVDFLEWLYPPVVPDPKPDPVPAGSNVARTLGFFGGSYWAWDLEKMAERRHETAEKQLGRPIRFSTVMLDQGKPEGLASKMVASAHFLVASGKIWEFRDRIVPIVSVPLAFRAPKVTREQALQDTVDGRYDNEFLAVAAMSEADGTRSVDDYPDKYARIGWEVNGNWPNWSGRDGREALFVTAFRRVGRIFLAHGWKLVWCCMESQWTLGYGPEMYPGEIDGHKVVANLDMYRRDSRRPKIADLQAHADWAIGKGLKVGYAEYGYGSDTPGADAGTIVDDGEWMTELAQFFRSLGDHLAFQCVFSPPDRDVLSAVKLPNVHRAWVKAFGKP